MEAWERVKANKGSAGADNQSIEDYEKNLKDNLYKLWNRMSSGSYYPPHVKLVEIDKENGKKRPLGIPTVSDRVAQMVCKIYFEPLVERHFHKDSYGYRHGKSAHHAVGKCRERCFKSDWVIDLDIKGFFDNIDHDLMIKAVKHHADKEWITMYIERWLKVPMIMPDGTVKGRIKGTPQGGVISPLLANLFLHYVFDKWIERTQPNITFERYADDCVIHCKTEKQARYILARIEERLKECKLELNLEKTKIVYCKDDKRKYCNEYKHYKFDFLGYTFRPRKCKSKEGVIFIGFVPAISDKACKKIKEELRKLRIRRWTRHNIQDIAVDLNDRLRGWINYYGKFYGSALQKIFKMFNQILLRWAMKRYKKLRGKWMKAWNWLSQIALENKELFAHWKIGMTPKLAGQ
jgi:RNA-directed DNA polymerase